MGSENTVTVRKLDHDGHEVAAYPGKVLERTAHSIVLRTSWKLESRDLSFVRLETGDRWVEYFYSDRWYNVFEMHGTNDELKGWYCNVCRPAQIGEGEVTAEDLALDLWVSPDGEMTLLDEDEFAELELPPEEKLAALDALAELRRKVQQGERPFGTLQEMG